MEANARMDRRGFLKAASFAAARAHAGLAGLAMAQDKGQRPARADGVEVLNPRGRVPVGLIIDDSTCLVNLGHFGMPQFAEAWPDRETIRSRGGSCRARSPTPSSASSASGAREHGVKGKYSIVPYPACVGWLDRDLPGWSQQELRDSLDLVRTLMVPNWDIHPEMITHTRVIDTKTGRPYAERERRGSWRTGTGPTASRSTNWPTTWPTPCGSSRTSACRAKASPRPAGSATACLPELAQATLRPCRDVFRPEIPHYFRHLFTDDQSVAPRVEYASRLWTGPIRAAWSRSSAAPATGSAAGTADAGLGRPVHHRGSQERAHGRRDRARRAGDHGLPLAGHLLQRPGARLSRSSRKSVRRLHARYDHLIWMKLSEIARYWAAKELTRIEPTGWEMRFHAPFAAKDFTVKVRVGAARFGDTCLRRVQDAARLESGTRLQAAGRVTGRLRFAQRGIGFGVLRASITAGLE